MMPEVQKACEEGQVLVCCESKVSEELQVLATRLMPEIQKACEDIQVLADLDVQRVVQDVALKVMVVVQEGNTNTIGLTVIG